MQLPACVPAKAAEGSLGTWASAPQQAAPVGSLRFLVSGPALAVVTP